MHSDKNCDTLYMIQKISVPFFCKTSKTVKSLVDEMLFFIDKRKRVVVQWRWIFALKGHFTRKIELWSNLLSIDEIGYLIISEKERTLSI